MKSSQRAGSDEPAESDISLLGARRSYSMVSRIGMVLAVLIVLAGHERLPILPVILIGGSLLAVLRLKKRHLLNALGAHDRVNRPQSSGWDPSATGLRAAIWAAMILVAAFWYGLGFGLRYLISLF